MHGPTDSRWPTWQQSLIAVVLDTSKGVTARFICASKSGGNGLFGLYEQASKNFVEFVSKSLAKTARCLLIT